MAEIVTLNTPAVATDTTYSIRYFGIDLVLSRIIVELLFNTGRVSSVVYGPTGIVVDGVQGAATPTGATLLSALNVSNNAAGTSMIKRVYQRLTTDGIGAGTISGTPQ